MRNAISGLAIFVFAWAIHPVMGSRPDETSTTTRENKMQLGNFSISLTVKDVKVSKDFYEKLGFKVSGGDLKKNYIIMQNDTSTIGLYQGMFDKNSLTYNPGWDRDCNTLEDFQDVREIQKELKSRGLNPVVAADEATSGTAYLVLADPDGNPILIDQHVPKPKKNE